MATERMSNFGGNLKSGFKKGILSARKSNALKEIRASLGQSWKNLKHQFKVLRPVYKVMVTIPSRNITGGTITPQRYIIADTSRPYTNFMDKADSPILGLWIDQSDITEPDKAIVLMYNPTRQTDGIFEQDITNFKQYGVRNWLDIWLGYSTSAVGSAVVDLGGFADRFKLSTGGIRSKIASKVPFTFPDPFFFGNESHVFSGPIVSIKRHITSTGDRLQIIGFSPIIALRQSVSWKFFFPESKLTIANAMKHVVETKVVRFSPTAREHWLQLRGFYEDSYNEHFWMGNFTHRMFTGGGDHLRIAPINMRRVEVNDSAFFTNPYSDNDMVMKKLKKFELDDEYSTKLSLYDILFTELTEPTKNGGLVGLYGFIRHAMTADNKLMDAFNDGPGHPGVFIKYGFKFEIDDIATMIDDKKRFGPVMKQTLTLGMDAKEFEAGIEYGTVFNTRPLMIKDDKVDGGAKFVKIPTDLEVLENYLGLDDPFWNSLLEDIVTYGETVHPIHKWLHTEMDKAIDPKDEDLDDPLKNMMRRSYFSGISGSVFAVGNPEMKPGRILEIKDVRGTGLNRLDNIVTDGFKKIIKFRQGDENIAPHLKLKGTNKEYYIWKVRHYLGIGSGYLTKVYFAEERNRSWSVYTRSVDQIIRKALAQSKNAEV